MAPTRVFISFDYDHDVVLKNPLVGQAKNDDSPFSLADWSIKEHIDENWKAAARARIRAVDVVCVICGEHTDSASGVSAELKIAQDEGVAYFLLRGYSDKACAKPRAAREADKLYTWTWENLKTLVQGGR